jgi:hypothetical protein
MTTRAAPRQHNLPLCDGFLDFLDYQQRKSSHRQPGWHTTVREGDISAWVGRGRGGRARPQFFS